MWTIVIIIVNLMVQFSIIMDNVIGCKITMCSINPI